MADFQAAIGNIVVSSTLITVDDQSNYEATLIPNGQDGHLTADFSDYRKIIMTAPKRTFVYSTEGDGDIITSSADSAVLSFSFNLDPDDIDGVYDFTIYTVPTLDTNVLTVYDRHEAVYDGGILYKSKINSNTNKTPATSSDWEQIDESLIPAKYCVTDSVIITDLNLIDCYEGLVASAVCGLDNDFCGDMCDNEEFMDAMKMRLLVDALCTAAANNDFKGARKLFNLANQLCGCTNC